MDSPLERRVSFGGTMTVAVTPFTSERSDSARNVGSSADSSESRDIPGDDGSSVHASGSHDDPDEETIPSLEEVYSHFELLKIRTASLFPRMETPVNLVLDSPLWKKRRSRSDSQQSDSFSDSQSDAQSDPYIGK
eukprot:TRINITY_DN57283_c0_g1_i1.p1 TRINITY_DN57283_c0_g1~~TRINITY_DN57283_c0_g1_i1.p1  ORF type:complete len:156 (+),score=21.86 TRINITY_DN57283_c0_g1_i1:66-470(+)